MMMLALLTSVFKNDSAFAETIQDLIQRDAKEELNTIQDKKNRLDEYKDQLSNIDFHLKKAKEGQTIYLQFDRIAGSLIVVGIMIGSYQTKFPPGLRAMIAAYTTVTGLSRGFIKLTPIQLKFFMGHVTMLQKKIAEANTKLDQEAHYYCRINPDHDLCQ